MLDIGMIDAPNCVRLGQLEGTFEYCPHDFPKMEISLMTWSGKVKSPDDRSGLSGFDLVRPGS